MESPINQIEFSQIDEVNPKIRELFKNFISKDSKTFWSKFGRKNFHLMFQYWLKYKQNNLDFEWIVKREFFGMGEEEWEKYVERLFNYSGIIVSPDLQSFTIEGDKKLRFDSIYNQAFEFCERRDSKVKELDTQNESVEGIEVNSEGKYEIKNEIVTNNVVDSLIRKIAPFIPEFKLMGDLTQINYLEDNYESIQRVKTKVLKRIRLKVQIKWIADYIYVCPRCKVSLLKEPDEMSAKSISHFPCPMSGTTPVAISRGAYKEGKTLNLYCYEVYVFDANNNKDKKQFFSFDSNLARGYYMMDVVNFKGRIVAPDDRNKKTVILGVERITPKLGFEFNRLRGMELARKYGVKYHKIFDIQAGIIDYYKTKNIIIKPEMGGLIQQYLLMSALMKVVFKHQYYLISVIGDTSLSKTYPSKLFCEILDTDYEYVSRDTFSEAGFLGGVNVNYNIGGVNMSQFQEGIVTTAGLLTLDEAENFYDLNEPYNSLLKSMQNESSNIRKIGGEEVPLNCTPIILCNLFKHHRNENEKEKSYISEIKQLYYRRIAKVDETELAQYHKKTRIDSDRYVMQQDLFLPLQFIENKYLQQVIGWIRNKYKHNDLCWYTGGTLAAQNRIFFDCICKINEYVNDDEESFTDVGSVGAHNQNQTNLPTEDFCYSVRKYLLGDKDIGLTYFGREKNNSDIEEQIKKLSANVEKYLKGEGKFIETHFKDGARRVDSKIQELIVALYIGVQLINDIDATDLDSATKDYMSNVLLKTKRGVTVDEYNFISHTYHPNKEIIEAKILNEFEYYTDFINQEAEDKLKEKGREEGKAEVLAEFGLNKIISLDDDKKKTGKDGDEE